MGFSFELDEDTARLLHEEVGRQEITSQELGRRYLRDLLSKAALHDEGTAKPFGETDMEFFDRMVRETEEISRRTRPRFPTMR